jgi:hypothetical protein
MSEATPVAASIRFASTDIVPIPKRRERIRCRGRIPKAPTVDPRRAHSNSFRGSRVRSPGALNGCQEIGGARG